MFEIIKAGGPLMWPILASSIIALAIIAERFWSLRADHISPPNMLNQVIGWIDNNQLDVKHIQALYDTSPLGRVLAVGLLNKHDRREVIKEAIEDAGRQVTHQLERFLTTLGTIAMITPLLGLLGTVLGMINVFTVISTAGVGDPQQLSGGISQALITTATGLTVAIPALIFHRLFRRKVDSLVMDMEQEATRLIETLHEHNQGS